MLRRLVSPQASRICRVSRISAHQSPLSTVARDYEYFENFEMKDGVAIIRLNGPGKMNTISQGLQAEAEKIFNDKIINNSDVKAVVFISSKPDSFIAGADIDMIKKIEDKSQLMELCMKGHLFFREAKKVGSWPSSR